MIVLVSATILAGVLASFCLLFAGYVEVAMGRSVVPQFTDQVLVRIGGIIKLSGVAALVVSPWVAASFAAERSAWVDADGNGMLDPFVNGGHDWVDVVLDTFLWVWAALIIAVVVAVVIGTAVLALVQRRTQP